MKTTSLAICASIAVLGGVLTNSTNADALSRSMHAMRCFAPGSSINSAGQVYNPSASQMQFFCPVESDTMLSFKDAGISAVAHGFSNGNWEGKACYTFGAGGGVGGSCGTPLTTVGSGVVHMSLNMNGWSPAIPSDYPYVLVTMGGVLSGSNNVIWGITLTK